MMMKPFQIEKNSEKKNIADPKGKRKKRTRWEAECLIERQHPQNTKILTRVPKTAPKSAKNTHPGCKETKPKNTKILTRIAKTAPKSAKKHSPGQ
jgi:hypothetical protein